MSWGNLLIYESFPYFFLGPSYKTKALCFLCGWDKTSARRMGCGRDWLARFPFFGDFFGKKVTKRGFPLLLLRIISGLYFYRTPPIFFKKVRFKTTGTFEVPVVCV